MKHNLKVIILSTCSMLPILSCATQQKPRRFSTWFSTPVHEETITKEYTLSKPSTISVINPYGSITIKAEWAQKTIALSARKKTSALVALPMMNITEQRSANGDITLTVVCDNADKTPPTLDLVLVVPEKSELKLSTTAGAITAEHIQAAIWATTTKGTITLTNMRGTVVAETKEQAPITINQAYGNIKATTKRGAINVCDSTESVLAATEKGAIKLSCKKLPARGKLTIQSTSGAIDLTLPVETNADIVAKTKYGSVTCTHFVTVKPFTTQWNRKAWRQLKQEICDTLGTGEALINIQNDRGNIRIN